MQVAKRCTDALLDMVRDKARRDCAAARERVMRNIERIGYVRSVREGMNSIREEWVEGTRYMEIRARALEITMKKDFFVEQKKQANSASKQRKGSSSGGTSNLSSPAPGGFAEPAPPSAVRSLEYNDEVEVPTLEIKR